MNIRLDKIKRAIVNIILAIIIIAIFIVKIIVDGFEGIYLVWAIIYILGFLEVVFAYRFSWLSNYLRDIKYQNVRNPEPSEMAVYVTRAVGYVIMLVSLMFLVSA